MHTLSHTHTHRAAHTHTHRGLHTHTHTHTHTQGCTHTHTHHTHHTHTHARTKNTKKKPINRTIQITAELITVSVLDEQVSLVFDRRVDNEKKKKKKTKKNPGKVSDWYTLSYCVLVS